MVGRYLPGPPGSTGGDFWVGDTVRVHTGSTPWDIDEQDFRVMAVNIAEEENAELAVIPELVGLPGAVPGRLLIALVVSGSEREPDVTGWTKAWWSGNFAYPVQNSGCGAGPPVNQCAGWYYRSLVEDEDEDVLTIIGGGVERWSAWVWEIEGVSLSGLTVIDETLAVIANGGTPTVSATASSPSVLIGGTIFAKVDYDSGWASGWGVACGSGPLITGGVGTPLLTDVGRSASNGTAGEPPWAWVAYATGTGSLSVSCVPDSHGCGVGAYACGFMTVRGGLLIPTPGTFAVVQSGHAGQGSSITVTLPSPPG